MSKNIFYFFPSLRAGGIWLVPRAGGILRFCPLTVAESLAALFTSLFGRLTRPFIRPFLFLFFPSTLLPSPQPLLLRLHIPHLHCLPSPHFVSFLNYSHQPLISFDQLGSWPIQVKKLISFYHDTSNDSCKIENAIIDPTVKPIKNYNMASEFHASCSWLTVVLFKLMRFHFKKGPNYPHYTTRFSQTKG